MNTSIDLSIVIPVYNGALTIGRLVDAIVNLDIDASVEIILINDGSADNSREVCEELTRTTPLPVTFIDHARNYGEHNALMSGLRIARGNYIITMDDDLQNPPSEVVKLYNYAAQNQFDVVYTYFEKKEHAAWRNIGSWLANKTANWVLDKPDDLYLSSFRCIKQFVAKEIIRYKGPFPYVDGLIFQVTKNIGKVLVEHLPRAESASNYTLSRLVRLWMSILLNFSVVPLRIGTVLGLLMSAFGVIAVVYVLIDYFVFGIETAGWASLMIVFLLFSGVQLVVLGLAGEYIGRIYLTVNARPQTVIRSITPDRRSESATDAPTRTDRRAENLL
ncbi:MAG: glycosyltransferase family 2 protein [Thiogranum sp.]|nr:glycosyltransferase family 2 protein [Thiogranum sp.]